MILAGYKQWQKPIHSHVLIKSFRWEILGLQSTSGAFQRDGERRHRALLDISASFIQCGGAGALQSGHWREWSPGAHWKSLGWASLRWLLILFVWTCFAHFAPWCSTVVDHVDQPFFISMGHNYMSHKSPITLGFPDAFGHLHIRRLDVRTCQVWSLTTSWRAFGCLTMSWTWMVPRH